MSIDKSCIQKIAVFRALQLGDLLCSIPAVRALRREFPAAEIFLIGLPSAKGLLGRFAGYFNGFISFPGFPGLTEQSYNVHEIAEFIIRMQKEQFDLVLQMQGDGSIVNPLMELLGARYTAGFYRPQDYQPQGGLFMEYPDGHEVERHLALMYHLKIPSQGKYLEFPVSDADERDLASAGLLFQKGTYVCVHPGSRGSWRQWPAVNFASLADYCAQQGKKVIITGTEDERDVINAVSSAMKSENIVACGKTSLGAMGVLLKNAFALISNCTGVSHMASALNTPGLIISMDGEPERWGPMNKDLLYTLDWTKEPYFHRAEHALTELFQKYQGKAEVVHNNAG